MKIQGIQKLTLIDFPGKIACTVFLSGCNYRCPWCHNPELVLEGIIGEQSPISPKDFFQFLKEKRGLLEGVCICGGEPTLNEGLFDFCQKIKKTGYDIKLDTNGSNPEMLEGLIEKGLVDYVAMDIKGPRDKYIEIIGFKDSLDNYILDKIERSINVLKKEKVDYEFRTTLVPGLIEREDILKIVQWIKPAKKYVLQNFRPGKSVDSRFEKMKSFPDEFLVSLQQAIIPFFEKVEIR